LELLKLPESGTARPSLLPDRDGNQEETDRYCKAIVWNGGRKGGGNDCWDSRQPTPLALTDALAAGDRFPRQLGARVESFNSDATNLYWKDVVFRVQVPWGDLV